MIHLFSTLGQFLRIAPDLFLDLLSQSQFFLVTPSERANAFVFQYIQQNASSFTAVQLLLLIPLLPPYVATDSKRLDILESFIKSASAMCFTLIVDDALAVRNSASQKRLSCFDWHHHR